MKQLTTILLLLTVFTACKTRKVSTQTSTVSQSSSVAVNKTVYDSSSTKSIDTSKMVTSAVTEAKTSQQKDATLYADSIVQTKSNGATKTVIYPTKGKPINYSSLNTDNSKSTTDITDKKGVSISNDSVFKLNLDSIAKAKKDSLNALRDVTATGSGTVYAKWIGIAILVFAVLMAVVIYLKSKKPKI